MRFDALDGETFTMPSGEVVPAYELVDWEVPREAPADWVDAAVVAEEDSPRRHEEHEEEGNEESSCAPCLRGEKITQALRDFWDARIARQREIDASIAAKADFEYLYDKPYEDKKTVRVAGPFTVETLSPHRVLGVDEDDELIGVEDDEGEYEERDFVGMILESLRAAGVQQAHKEDRIGFTSLTPWPGELICAEGEFLVDSGEWIVASGAASAADNHSKQRERSEPPPLSTNHEPLTTTKRAGIFVGPEFGTVSRPDLVQAAREAADAGFDVLIACAFSFDAHSADLTKLGRLPILKARMNADLHMATELADTGKGNLFVIFGEPDLVVDSGQWLVAGDGRLVACYERVKELSGLGSLEEINRLGREDLPGLKRLSGGRTVRTDQPAAAGGSLGTGEHRGGRGADGDQGVPAVLEHRERVSGRGGNAPAAGASSADARKGDLHRAVPRGERARQDADGLEKIPAVQALTEADFPSN